MIYERANHRNTFWAWSERKSEIQCNVDKKGESDRIEHHKSIEFEFVVFFIDSIEPKSHKKEHNKNHLYIRSKMYKFYLKG